MRHRRRGREPGTYCQTIEGLVKAAADPTFRREDGGVEESIEEVHRQHVQRERLVLHGHGRHDFPNQTQSLLYIVLTEEFLQQCFVVCEDCTIESAVEAERGEGKIVGYLGMEIVLEQLLSDFRRFFNRIKRLLEELESELLGGRCEDGGVQQVVAGVAVGGVLDLEGGHGAGWDGSRGLSKCLI